MKLRYTLPVLAAFGLALSGCQDTIDPADRYKPVENPASARTVLIEEYTGVDCKNCPDGHERLASLETYYNTPENLANQTGIIAVGIHIPAYGDAVSQGGFVTPEAASLSENQSTAPAARINRRTEALDMNRWQTVVAAEITRKPGVTFGPISAEYANGKISVSGVALTDEAITDARLNIWIVEDDITEWQLMPDGKYNGEYVHHAVYRASLTGLRGQEIALTRNTPVEFSAPAYPMSPAWNPANLRAVIFIDTPSAGVLNAAEAKIL